MTVLLLSALAIGALHALAPDHWLPFVMLGKARAWSRRRLTAVTVLAGIGHVGSSLVIAVAGLLLGTALSELRIVDAYRGNVAALALVALGLFIALRAAKNLGRRRVDAVDRSRAVTYWTLFAVIVFGPCEPLVPLLFAAFVSGWSAVLAAFAVFSTATIGMMLAQVHLAASGVALIRSVRIERFSDVLAGAAIALTGVVVYVFQI